LVSARSGPKFWAVYLSPPAGSCDRSADLQWTNVETANGQTAAVEASISKILKIYTSPKRKQALERRKTIPWIWPAALALFVLAGLTGSLLRYGQLQGLPTGLYLVNVRHAHSHLMYFGWATPALMGVIAAWLPRLIGRPISRRFQWAMGATMIAALLAYVPFLLFGYQSAEIGGSRLPISVLAATLNVLAWYVYAFLYFKATWGVTRVRPLRFWDAALIFIILASFGAWGVAVVTRLGVEDPFWSVAMTHLFLDLFSEGWFVLATLGLVYAAHQPASEKAARWGEQLIVIGLPVLFLLAMPVNLVPGGLRAIAGIGGLLVGTGLLLSVGALWSNISAGVAGWRVPLALLALKAVIGLGMVLPVTARWAQQNGLRIFYLHALLLGFITLGLVVAAREMWGKAAVVGQRWLVAAVLILLLFLLPLTGIWPVALSGRWALQAAVVISFGPVLVVASMLLRVLFGGRQQVTQKPESAGHPGE
jgi:hypothetical protein